MGYKYAGKHPTRTQYYMPPDEREMAAKFAYFREAENGINGGPAPIQANGECGTNGGYMKHWRRKEERCDPCKAAHVRAEMVRYWVQKRLMPNPQAINNNRREMMPEIAQSTSKIGSTRQHKSGPGMCYQHESGA